MAGMRASLPTRKAFILPDLIQRRSVNGCKPILRAATPTRMGGGSSIFFILSSPFCHATWAHNMVSSRQKFSDEGFHFSTMGSGLDGWIVPAYRFFDRKIRIAAPG